MPHLITSPLYLSERLQGCAMSWLQVKMAIFIRYQFVICLGIWFHGSLFQIELFFHLKKAQHSSTCSHTCTWWHTHTHWHTNTNSQCYLKRDLCNCKPSHSSISLSSRANRGTGVCRRIVYQPSLSGVLQRSIPVSGLVSGHNNRWWVYAHHCRKPTELRLCEAPPTTQRENWISSDGYQTYSKSWQLFVD